MTDEQITTGEREMITSGQAQAAEPASILMAADYSDCSLNKLNDRMISIRQKLGCITDEMNAYADRLTGPQSETEQVGRVGELENAGAVGAIERSVCSLEEQLQDFGRAYSRLDGLA